MRSLILEGFRDIIKGEALPNLLDGRAHLFFSPLMQQHIGNGHSKGHMVKAHYWLYLPTRLLWRRECSDSLPLGSDTSI